MRNQGMMARPAARKGKANERRSQKTTAVASKPGAFVQTVERRSSSQILELPKKPGSLPTPSSTFVF